MATADKHYGLALESRLRSLLATGDWERVVRHIDTLSNSQFRTAGYLLGEKLMRELGEGDFWAMAGTMISHNSKAYLVTALKCAVARGLDVSNEGFARVCLRVKENKTDVGKTLRLLIPTLQEPEHISLLFNSLNVTEPQTRLAYLIRVRTEAASYVLLHTLKSLDHERALLVRVVRHLMKQGDGMSFNLASMLRTYFALDEVKGTFSREVEPYKLSMLDGSYEAFRKMLNR